MFYKILKSLINSEKSQLKKLKFKNGFFLILACIFLKSSSLIKFKMNIMNPQSQYN